MRYLFAVPALLVLAGCATAPKPLQGEFDADTPRAQVADGQRVRWGGTIIDVQPKPEETCIQVLGKALSGNARPMFSDDSEGRFVACRQGFYDPAVFAQGREVTVTGTAAGTELRKIGEYDYPLPRVAADVIYLWPERYSFDQPYWDPYWVWWPYGYYNWYGPTLRWGYYGHGHYGHGHGHGHGGKAVEGHEAPAK